MLPFFMEVMMTIDYQLIPAESSHLIPLMSWFQDETSLKQWGGPHMRFPIRSRRFRKDIRWPELNSYVLTTTQVNSRGFQTYAGFGQVYQRLNRHHLGRLVINPEIRGQSLGKTLIQLLISEAQKRLYLTQSSLFVYRHNTAAWKCYSALGYEEAEYPAEATKIDDVAFMVMNI